MSITVGADTYGCVKTVGGTPVVTKFAMFQSLPIYPVQSFYFSGINETQTLGVPLVGSAETVTVHGIPLDRVDRVSVAMAYVRGIFGAMTVFGFMAIVPLIMHFSGDRLDDFGMIAMRGLIACFLFGVTGGLLTYAIPLTPRRERRIRSYCGELLGICVDPARVAGETSAAIEEYVTQIASQEVRADSRFDLIQQLISIRSKFAQGVDVDAMERQTDQLLDRLDELPNYPT